MKKSWIVAVLLVFAFVSVGCKQKVVTKPEDQPQVQEKKAEAVKPAPEKAAEPKPAPKEVIAKKDVTVEHPAEKPAAPVVAAEGFKDVLFDYDRYDIKDPDKPALKEVADFMMKNSQATLSIEGHCDERGTNEYNLALGDRRAKAAREFLVSLGVASSRMDTISYGEERPLCTDQTEDCWAKNRRAHFVALGKAGK